MSKEQGPNQTDKQGGPTDKKQHQQGGHGGEAQNPHTGGVGNRQDEPNTAEEAKKRAAETAHKK